MPLSAWYARCGIKSYTTLDGNAHVVVCSNGLTVNLDKNAVKDVKASSARAGPDVR